MKRKPYPLTDLTGGLDVSAVPYLLTNQASPYNNECWFDQGILKKLPGTTVFSAATGISGRPMHFATYWPYSGAKTNLMFTQTNSYEWNGTTLSWDDITYDDGSPVPWTGELHNRFSSCHLNDMLIVTNGKDEMQKFEGTAMDALGGTPPKLRSIIAFQNRVVGVYVVDVTNYPSRIQWSDVGDPETWDGETSGYIDLVDTVDACVCIILLGDKAFIFKERSIWSLNYVGGTRVFIPELIVDDVGTYAPDSIAYFENYIIFKGNEGMYTFDGQRVTSVAPQIFPLLAQPGRMVLNKSTEYVCYGIVIQETGEYWFAFPTSGDTPDRLYRYNRQEEAWLQSLDYDAVCFGYGYTADDPPAWDELTGTWAAWVGSWKSSALSESTPFTLIGKTDGSVERYDMTVGNTSTLQWETKDFIFGQSHRLAYVQVRARYGDVE